MEWKTNKTRLPYHLFTHREELRRRRRRERVMKAPKSAITDLLKMNNTEEAFRMHKEKAVQITEVLDIHMELHVSAEDNSEKIYTNLDCKLNENVDYGKTDAAVGVSSRNTIWDLDDMMKGNMNEERTKASYNFSSSTKNNEPMSMNNDLVDEICNSFNISFDDGLNVGNSEMKKMEAYLNLEEF